MTLYLTDNTSAAEIERARASGAIFGCKLYPAGATTHSDAGVTDIARLEPVLAAMSAHDGCRCWCMARSPTRRSMCLIARRASSTRVLAPLCERWPSKLRIVFEHVTTRAAVEFVRGARAGVAATVTPQHLLHNRNALFPAACARTCTACRC
jgi:dihydroorotase